MKTYIIVSYATIFLFLSMVNKNPDNIIDFDRNDSIILAAAPLSFATIIIVESACNIVLDCPKKEEK